MLSLILDPVQSEWTLLLPLSWMDVCHRAKIITRSRFSYNMRDFLHRWLRVQSQTAVIVLQKKNMDSITGLLTLAISG